ncbi:hypothetical protein HMPREF9278_0115 [Mobiluncus mulieris FB024-16]|nr:hypothetical protein HMPREF9278_0115 [Mobiluncus mulieris FB024-16]
MSGFEEPRLSIKSSRSSVKEYRVCFLRVLDVWTESAPKGLIDSQKEW